MRAIKYFILTLCLMLLVNCIGCGTPKTSAPKTDQGPSKQTEPTPVKLPKKEIDLGEFKASQPSKPYKFGISVPHFRDPYWIAIVYGLIDEAERWGCQVVATYEAGGYANLAEQVKQMEDLAQQSVDAILFAPVDYEGTAAIADQLASKGITIINVANLSRSEKIPYGVNNYDPDVGTNMAEFIAKKLNGKGKVALLNGPAGANWAMDRVDAFKATIKGKYPEMEIIGDKCTEVDRAVAQKVVEDWIQAHPQIDAIGSITALLGEGAVSALEQAGRKKNTIVATSTLNKETYEMLKASRIDYVQSERPVYIGRLGLQLAIKYLNGESVTIEKKGTLDLPPKILWVSSPFYTPEDASKIVTENDWAPEGWKPR